MPSSGDAGGHASSDRDERSTPRADAGRDSELPDIEVFRPRDPVARALGLRTGRAGAVDPRLAAVFSGDAWMQRSAKAADTVSLGELAGYRLVRVVARGTQGTVYEALEPRTNRRVAIKRLPNADASVTERARFLRETEALAGLTHPNVVALLNAPEDDGARLIVMEWIDGSPLDEWSDRCWARLPTREAMQTVVAVLLKAVNGVAAAHARGTIHRDLKPSNMLVTGADEPKVLDFGLAKPVGSRHESSLAAGFTGTPSWASPEQVEGRTADVDARSDVHALGLLLYRALAGRTAFNGELPIVELFEQIRFLVPPPPSRFRAVVPRELDLVVMRAIDKDPSRRYQTAEAFARDLTRFLAGEPVEAHPPSTAYLVRKFVRRRRALTAAIAVATVAVIAGSIATARMAVIARESRDDAIARANEAERARDRAERMNGFFQDLMANLRERSAAGERSTAREIIGLAVASLEASDQPRESEADLRTTLGTALLEIGDYPGAMRLLQSATELLAQEDDRTELARVLLLRSSAASRAADHAQAESVARSAIDVLHASGGPEAMRARAHERLAYALVGADRPREAVAEADLAVRAATAASDELALADAMSTRSLALQIGGRLDEAVPSAVEAAAIARRLTTIKPLEKARLLHNAAFLLIERGNIEEALPYTDESLAIREAHYGKSHPAVIPARTQLGNALRQLNRLAEAIEVHRASIAMIDAASSSAEPSQQLLRSNTMRHLARCHESRAEPEDLAAAAALYGDAMRLYARSHSEQITVMISSARSLYRLSYNRDGLPGLLTQLSTIPAEVAALAGDPAIEGLARCEAAYLLLAAHKSGLFTPDAELVRTFRRDLATVEAHRGPGSTEALRVRLALAHVLACSPSEALRAEARQLVEAIAVDGAESRGESDRLMQLAQRLGATLGTGKPGETAPPAAPTPAGR